MSASYHNVMFFSSAFITSLNCFTTIIIFNFVVTNQNLRKAGTCESIMLSCQLLIESKKQQWLGLPQVHRRDVKIFKTNRRLMHEVWLVIVAGSRSNSPSSRLFLSSAATGGHGVPGSTGRPRRRSGIPRSQGTSRETSPARYGYSAGTTGTLINYHLLFHHNTGCFIIKMP